ncbi:hypothetical protein COY90_01990 [Candidatus Roizmanbacteria bacterium CG_4_10_14_0_8_um_filter_39_9]|uniref:Phospholipid/glycerol acyltransferase domain-containing protein n=1 Tax=Candidatus Roizmanbacteria bacterium CG_4_10_14_0_8_um_filter_39_9 TaxID=1974829 RepID=A0A2M7QDB3_9BACT|nr:MAG: hypothetical protein COY90_01990 [Candidatus Roizmanbacteria bacterium CG_4_10_14_0_8_um_filter_39_9]
MIFNKHLLQHTVQRTIEIGLQKATLELLDNLGVTSISKIGNVPEDGPLLIISNHTGVFDSLLLFSQISRADFHFIGLSHYAIFGPKVTERLLPIYRVRKLNHKIYEYPLCLQINGKKPVNLTVAEIRLRNKESIRQGAKLINDGNAVSIFPTGGGGKALNDSHWKAGVGFLVKQITNPLTRVVFVQIKGTRMSDLVAYLHPFIRKLFFRPRLISIYFSEPRLLTDLVDQKDDGKTIARKLEKIYQDAWK